MNSADIHSRSGNNSAPALPGTVFTYDQAPFEWLRRLRWLAAAGQALTLFVAAKWLGLPLQLLPLMAILMITIVTNFALGALPVRLKQLDSTIAAVLIVDVFLLTALLFYSGGPENPFSILYLLHVVLCAVLLNRRWTWIIAALSIGLFGLLFFGHIPLKTPANHPNLSHHSHGGELNTHLIGMWVAFSIVALISAYCISRISEELRRAERNSERLKLSQQRLASLTTLAAGAAHELATPLGTITIALEEIKRGLSANTGNSAIADDFDLIESQIEICKKIVAMMGGHSGEIAGEMNKKLHLSELARELDLTLSNRFGDLVTVESPYVDTAVAVPPKTVINALAALAKNGIEATDNGTPVLIKVEVRPGGCSFQVIDRGTGMPEDVLSRAGEPFFTTKAPGKGMGLGVFLARLAAEELGGRLGYSSIAGAGTTAEFFIPGQR